MVQLLFGEVLMTANIEGISTETFSYGEPILVSIPIGGIGRLLCRYTPEQRTCLDALTLQFTANTGAWEPLRVLYHESVGKVAHVRRERGCRQYVGQWCQGFVKTLYVLLALLKYPIGLLELTERDGGLELHGLEVVADKVVREPRIRIVLRPEMRAFSR